MWFWQPMVYNCFHYSPKGAVPQILLELCQTSQFLKSFATPRQRHEDVSPMWFSDISSPVPQLWWESLPAHTHEVWCCRMTLAPLHLHLPGAAFLWVHLENSIVCQGQFWLLSCSSLLVTFGCYLKWNHTQHSQMCTQPMAYHIKAILNFTVTVMEKRETGRVPGRRKR